MKITTIKLLALALAITVVAGGALLLLPGHSHAAVNCVSGGVADTDCDGFTDAQESSGGGITLRDNSRVEPCSVPPPTDFTRNNCLDPNSKDVFIILAKTASGSVIDARFPAGQDPLEILKRTGAGSLGIAIHGITPAQAASNRVVIGSQKAIKITENLTTNGSTTGICTQGSPNGTDGCVVYTQKIVNVVTAACPSGTQCLVNGSAENTVDAVILTYLKNTIAHEASHSMKLAPTYNANFGGNHYQIGTNVVMDQSVYYTTVSGRTTFFLPGTYTNPDIAGATLR